MGFNTGDFVIVEYSIRVKDTGNLIDTTNEELAKKENIYNPDKIYGPTLIVVGKNWINKYVEEEIAKMNVGEEKVIEIPPEKAFGPRDPSKVKTYRLTFFKRRGIDVRVGEVIDFGGVQGVVKSITGGRVLIDFNHPLAGKTLLYYVKIVDKIDDLIGKVKSLAVKHLNIKDVELSITYNSDSREVVIEIPSKYLTRRDLQYGKLTLAMDILELLKDSVDRIVFKEVISRVREEEKREVESSSESTQ